MTTRQEVPLEVPMEWGELCLARKIIFLFEEEGKPLETIDELSPSVRGSLERYAPSTLSMADLREWLEKRTVDFAPKTNNPLHPHLI